VGSIPTRPTDRPTRVQSAVVVERTEGSELVVRLRQTDDLYEALLPGRPDIVHDDRPTADQIAADLRSELYREVERLARTPIRWTGRAGPADVEVVLAGPRGRVVSGATRATAYVRYAEGSRSDVVVQQARPDGSVLTTRRPRPSQSEWEVLAPLLDGLVDATEADDGGAEEATAPAAATTVWRPSRSGPLTDDDLVEASLLLDVLGSWIGRLPDGDRRLPEAQSIHAILRIQIALEDEADRVFVQRAVENLTRLMAAEIRTVVADATRDVGPEVAEPLRHGVDAVVGAAEADDDDAWFLGMDQVDTAVDRLVAMVPPSNTPAPEERFGRGKVVRAVALAAVTGTVGGLARYHAAGLTQQATDLALQIMSLWP
jgi:hypothetical protein